MDFEKGNETTSFHRGTVRSRVWALLTRTANRGQIPLTYLGKPAKLQEHSPLQSSPSCSSWGCSLKWSKLVKKLKFSSFTLLGQSFSVVPARGFCYISQMLRASPASLQGAPWKVNRAPRANRKQSKGAWVWPACSTAPSLVCQNRTDSWSSSHHESF